MKLALSFCLWQRSELEKIVIDYYKELQNTFDFDIVVVGSEGEKSRAIAEGCIYYEYPNSPVSNKHNFKMQCCKDYDLVIGIGSDDLIERKLFFYYLSLPIKKNTYYGFPDVYYWNPFTKKVAYWDGFYMGAGRAYPRQVLEKMNYNLWTDGINKGLDTSAKGNMNLKGIKIEQPLSLKELGAVILDIKGFGSITNNAIVNAAIDQNGEQSLSLLDRFPTWVIQKIKNLASE